MKRVSLNKNIQDLANVADEIVQLQQSVNTRFVEDEGHIKRESVHPLQGKATRMTTGMYGNLNININQSLRFFVKHNVDSGNYATLFGGIYLGGGTNLSFVAAPGQPQRQLWNDLRGNKLTEIVMTISETTMKLYKNGVLGFEFELTEGEKKAIQAGWRQRTSESVGVETIHFNHFNYALSPEEVKELYNNGRPDKVVFGNERKNKVQPILNNIVNGGTSAGLNFVSNIGNRSAAWSGVIENTSTSAARTNFIFNKDLIEGEAYTSKFIIKGNYIGKVYIRYGDIGVASGQTMIFNKLDTNDFEIYVELKKQGSATSGNDVIQVFFQLTTGQEFNTEIVNASTKIKACIAEYLPSSLTPTTWFDTSGNSNHLTATGTPELIYEEPIKDIVYSNSQPTESPQFKGQLHINSSTNKIYIGK